MSCWTKSDLSTAVRLMKIAYLGSPSEMQAGLSQWGWNLVANLKNADTDTRGYVAKETRSGNIAVVFPGTQSWTNAKTDLDIRPCSGLGATVHQGFWEAYQSIAVDLEHALAHNPIKTSVPGDSEDMSALCGAVSLLFIGHSLGGALATLAAYDRTFQVYRQKVGLITFGSPRVGYEDFVDAFEERMDRRTVRVVVNNDPIALIPTSPFHHTGGLLHISSSGKELGGFKRGLYAVINWFKGIRRLVVDLVKWTGFRDHNLNYYKEAVFNMDMNWKRPL